MNKYVNNEMLSIVAFDITADNIPTIKTGRRNLLQRTLNYQVLYVQHILIYIPDTYSGILSPDVNSLRPSGAFMCQ